VKDFPLRRRPQLYYETSIHAIKNMRRKMEDKHVCIPDFNMLFNLEVKGTSEVSRNLKTKTPSQTCFLIREAVINCNHISDGLG
jgi:hypothetical protein